MINDKSLIGKIVVHNQYGSGTIYKVTETNVFVSFEKKKRRFHYPEAFEKGYLVLKERKANVVPDPEYPDIVPQTKLSDEALEKLIEELIEKDKQYTEWSDM